MKLCECGCGQPAPISKYSQRSRGYVKGQPLRFRQGHGPKAGRVAKPIKDRFWPLVAVGDPNECWEWLGTRNEAGYGQVNQRKEMFYTHRVAYELSHGPIRDGLVVRHTCDNPPCCNPAHLLTGTHQQNSDDKIDRGREAWGEGSGAAKLTEREVLEARTKHAGGYTISALAREYGVTRVTIRQAVRGETWRRAA